jgi:hypothetical protein
VKRADATSKATPTHAKGELGSSNQAKGSVSNFIVMALNMSWQMAIVFLVPVIGGVKLDKHYDTNYLFTFIGLGVATVGSGLVMWRTLKLANNMPVPKLTAAQKRKIQKEYELEDED